MLQNNLLKKLSLVASIGLLANCSPRNFSAVSSGTNPATTQSSSAVPTSSESKNMKISLTSVSNPSLKSLVVQVARVDLLVSKDNQSALVNIAQNLGSIDLANLQNGLSQVLADIQLPAGVNVQQINLVLGALGNIATDINGNSCLLQLPSSLGNVLPLALGNSLNISGNSAFSLLMGIDTSSVSSSSNGTCSFNPTVGLASAFKFDLSSVLNDLTGNSSSNPLAGLTNAQDILGTLIPQLTQVNSTSSLGSFLGSLLGSFFSTAASPYTSIISALLGTGGISNSSQNLTSSLLSLPIDLLTGQFATGSGVSSFLQTLLGQQGSNNQTLLGSILSALIPGLSHPTTAANGTATFGSQASPLTLSQLTSLFGTSI